MAEREGLPPGIDYTGSDGFTVRRLIFTFDRTFFNRRYRLYLAYWERRFNELVTQFSIEYHAALFESGNSQSLAMMREELETDMVSFQTFVERNNWLGVITEIGTRPAGCTHRVIGDDAGVAGRLALLRRMGPEALTEADRYFLYCLRQWRHYCCLEGIVAENRRQRYQWLAVQLCYADLRHVINNPDLYIRQPQ